MRHILLDLKTGETFSLTAGWNKEEASIRTSRWWAEYRYYNTAVIAHKGWSNRWIAAVPLPHEPEEYT